MGSSRDRGPLTSRPFSPCSANASTHKKRVQVMGLGKACARSARERLPPRRCWVEANRGAGTSGASPAALGAARRRTVRQAGPELPNRPGEPSKFFLEGGGGHESCDSGLTGGLREATELRGQPGRWPQAGARARGSAGLAPSVGAGTRWPGGWPGRRAGGGGTWGWRPPPHPRPPGPGLGESRDAGSGEGGEPGMRGESPSFSSRRAVILRGRGGHHGGCESTPLPDRERGWGGRIAPATECCPSSRICCPGGWQGPGFPSAVVVEGHPSALA